MYKLRRRRRRRHQRLCGTFSAPICVCEKTGLVYVVAVYKQNAKNRDRQSKTSTRSQRVSWTGCDVNSDSDCSSEPTTNLYYCLLLNHIAEAEKNVQPSWQTFLHAVAHSRPLALTQIHRLCAISRTSHSLCCVAMGGFPSFIYSILSKCFVAFR